MDKLRILHMAGLAETQTAPALGKKIAEAEGPALVITSSFGRAESLSKDLSFYTDRPVCLLPDEDPFFFSFEAKSHGNLNARLRALIALDSGASCIVITPVSGAMKKMLPPERFRSSRLKLQRGIRLERKRLLEKLRAMGFEKSSSVENHGEYSLRGDILDIFPADSPLPVRVEFFDEEVETIRFFDPESQKSVEKVDRFTLYPAEEMLLSAAMREHAKESITRTYGEAMEGAEESAGRELKRRRNALLEYIETGTNQQLLENYLTHFTQTPAMLADFLPASGLIVLEDPVRIRASVELRRREASEDFAVMLARGHAVPKDFESFAEAEDLPAICRDRPLCLITPFDVSAEELGGVVAQDPKVIRRETYSAKRPAVFSGNLALFRTELKRYQREGFRTVVVCSSLQRQENLKEFLAREGLTGQVELSIGTISGGAELTSEKVVFLWDGEIFKSARTARKTRKRTLEKPSDRTPVRHFSDLSKGDFAVHEHHGIGRYEGIEHLTVQGAERDYLKIKYAGADVLYVPVDQMSLIQKYIGAGDAAPRVNKLSGGEWTKAKARVRADVANLAGELIRISAERAAREGHAFSEDTIWQKEFEDRFPWEETEDQLKCIAAVKKDMERPVPMDRLICGDVGYGKTEVALRAVFKCVADGKQAALLAPTTILASQHFDTFTRRFEDFPFLVDMLSRFRTSKEQSETLKKTAKGAVDVIIGTHRLLSSDVHFHDLGLLVVDEEQRFGVKHKERIKELKKNVDVLTLSATPIPRTLHMSLMGLRDMDLITEPPEERYPVQTYVMEQSDDVIRETIRRELDRNGQIYVVVPKVRGIERRGDEIRKLAPDARVAIAHGQMNEHALENIMMDFIDGACDILVSTTIIESGIDIPNVNTILIFEADHFGLSQLYQLRGRVGRTNKMAFAYLLCRKNKALSEAAEKRLRTIKEFTEFGVGFKIAMRDLELRGAGNLLGPEQHGHMASVGYELYCRLVDDAVSVLSGKAPRETEIDVQIDVPISAFIPDTFIEDEKLKLQAYKRIALIENEEEAEDVREELQDRFGHLQPPVENLIHVALLRRFAESAGVSRIWLERGSIHYRQSPEARRAGGETDLQGEIMTRLRNIQGIYDIINL